MALQSSGQISLSEIATEFNDSAPYSMSEYYRGGGKVDDTVSNAGVSASGQNGLGNFYSCKRYRGEVESLSSYTDATAIIDDGYGVEYTSATSSGVFVVPTGVTSIDVELAGGGSSAYCQTLYYNGSSWVYQKGYKGLGYKSANTGLSVTAGSSISLVVGANDNSGCFVNNGNSCSRSGGNSSSFGSYYSESGGAGCYANSGSAGNNVAGTVGTYSSGGQGGTHGGSGFVRVTWSQLP